MRRFVTMLALVVAVASAHADGAEPDIRMINELCGTYFAPVSLLPFWRMAGRRWSKGKKRS